MWMDRLGEKYEDDNTDGGDMSRAANPGPVNVATPRTPSGRNCSQLQRTQVIVPHVESCNIQQ